MILFDVLRRTGGVAAVSARVGMLPAEGSSTMEVCLPYLVAGFRRAYHRLGYEGFQVQLESLGGEEMAQAVLLVDTIVPSAGDAALRLAFGSNEAADKVESVLRGQLSLAPNILREILRLLAMLLVGYLASQAIRPELGWDNGLESALAEAGENSLAGILPPDQAT